MENPVLVEVSRGARVESVHRGAFALARSDGTLVRSAGDVAEPIFPRSTVKIFQAIPLVETGAAAAYGLSRSDLALACASHSGEREHVERARAMLKKGGLSEEALACGAHWPFDPRVARGLIERNEKPTQLHNNCSGKHVGFLLTALHRGETLEGYTDPNHPVQLRAREAISEYVGEALTEDRRATDGCSIPTYAVPLAALAKGFARVGTGDGIPPERALSARRLLDACMAHPFEMSGTGRFCLKLMEALPKRIFAKTGAEGVYGGTLPDLGLGFALKIDDGASRASEALVAAVIAAALEPYGRMRAGAIEAMSEKALNTWRGEEVGRIRAVLPH